MAESLGQGLLSLMCVSSGGVGGCVTPVARRRPLQISTDRFVDRLDLESQGNDCSRWEDTRMSALAG